MAKKISYDRHIIHHIWVCSKTFDNWPKWSVILLTFVIFFSKFKSTFKWVQISLQFWSSSPDCQLFTATPVFNSLSRLRLH